MSEKAIPTVYEWAGGLPAFERLTTVFYRHVLEDPILYPIFKNMPEDHPLHVALWLAEVFGGPKNYTNEHGGYPHMVAKHLNLGLKEEQRARWVQLIAAAADEAELPVDAEFRSAFISYIEWGTRIALTNSQPGVTPPMKLPVPRWDWGTAGPPTERIWEASAGEEEEEANIAQPSAEEPPSFARHIKPLFRSRDRQAMKWAFDLWEHADVARHATGIFQRLQQGSMPCDGAWSQEKVETFQRWMNSGMPE